MVLQDSSTCKATGVDCSVCGPNGSKEYPVLEGRKEESLSLIFLFVKCMCEGLVKYNSFALRVEKPDVLQVELFS